MSTNYLKMSFLGGPVGISGQQNVLGYNDSHITMLRKTLRDVFNKQNLQPSTNNYSARIGPFRLANNAGDFLNRKNYVCNVSNQVNETFPGRSRRNGVRNQCDMTGIPGSGCNPKYVYDSSDYITFKKQSAIQKNYNKLKQGGYTDSAYVSLKSVRN
jgi:hypothetical protein